jgi:hypothetical protein
MTPVQILTNARALIADPKNWGSTRLKQPNGCMCALGALLVASGFPVYDGVVDDAELDRPAYAALESTDPSPLTDSRHFLMLGVRHVSNMPPLDRKSGVMQVTRIYRFNDTRYKTGEHSDVMAAFDNAIARAQFA